MKAKVLLIPEYPTKYVGVYGEQKIIMVPAFYPGKWYLSYSSSDNETVFVALAQPPDAISSILEDAGYDLRHVVWSESESKTHGFNPFKKFDRPDHWKSFCPSVYFFKNEETGLIKIGESSNYIERVECLSSQNKTTLFLLGVMDGDYSMESAIHKRFSHLRSSGEWFVDHESIRKFIAEYCYMPPSFLVKVQRKRKYAYWLYGQRKVKHSE